MNFYITNNADLRPQKVVIYGPEGIGKTLLASKFPEPVFIDTEDSTKNYRINRLMLPDGSTRPTSWGILLEMVKAVRDRAIIAKTLVIDSLDWAETLCIQAVCAKYNQSGIESFGYGKGYTYLEEEFGKLLNLLSEVIDRGIHVVCTAHATMRRVELPEETGAYDHWEMKLEKRDAAITKEWADMVLFCNYKTLVVKGKTAMDKNKATGGKRVMYSVHTPWWDAKNRHDLPEEMPLDYAQIDHIFKIIDSYTTSESAESAISAASPEPQVIERAPQAQPVTQQTSQEQTEPEYTAGFVEIPDDDPDIPAEFPTADVATQGAPPGIPKPLWDLMQADGVSEAQVQAAVAKRGYYPAGTPIANYDPDFVAGCLVACWSQVKALM